VRQYIRHPSDIPITLKAVDRRAPKAKNLKDIGGGGLCFRAQGYVEPGNDVRISIPVREPAFEATGIVVWCRRTNEHFDVGLKFDSTTTDFAVRMVEQVCQVEHYKNQILENEGRKLSGDEAAAEWIEKFAGDFPR
jgi:hypothetical protein